MEKKHSKNVKRVLDYLKSNDGITSMEAFELFGVTRLSAIIYNLRKDNYVIQNEKMTCINRYGDTVYFDKYKLVGRYDA